MEIGLQAPPVHPDGLLYLRLSVHLVFLGQYMDDFLPRQHDQLVYLIAELFEILFSDNFFRIGSGYIIAVLEGTDMLSGNAYGYRPDLQA